MATFKFIGYITVSGDEIKTKKDAVDAMQTMVDDFESGSEDKTKVGIFWEDVIELWKVIV